MNITAMKLGNIINVLHCIGHVIVYLLILWTEVGVVSKQTTQTLGLAYQKNLTTQF